MENNFTVTGWYKRGEINDVTMQDDSKIDSSTINYHITDIHWDETIAQYWDNSKLVDVNELI